MEEYEQESERRGLPVQQVLGDDGDRRTALRSMVLTAGVVAVLVVLAVLVGSGGPWWFFGLLAAVAFATFALMVRNVRVWVAWGNPQLFLPSSEDLRLGDEIVARFRRRARGQSLRDGVIVTARLQCREAVVETTGATPDELVAWEEDLVVSRSEVSGSHLDADVVVRVPLFEAPPSMVLDHHEVQWHLVVHIEAPGIPDDDSTFVLTVAPAIAQRLMVGGQR